MGISPVWNGEFQKRFRHSYKEISDASNCLHEFYKNAYKNIKSKSKFKPLKKARNKAKKTDLKIINSIIANTSMNKNQERKEIDFSSVNVNHWESLKPSNLPQIGVNRNANFASNALTATAKEPGQKSTSSFPIKFSST